MMLEVLGEKEAAAKIEASVMKAVKK